MKQSEHNPLRDALAAGTAPEVHPEAELLAAFAEDFLLPRERQQMLVHLAGCARCRQIVELAAGAAPEALPAATAQPAPRFVFWRAWMPWAAMAAACVLVVGSVVLVQRREPEALQSARVEKSAPLAAAPADKQAENAPAPAAGIVAAPARSATNAPASAALKGEADKPAAERKSAAQAAPAPPPPAAQNQTVEVSAADQLVDVTQPQRKLEELLSRSDSATSRAAERERAANVETAKKARVVADARQPKAQLGSAAEAPGAHAGGASSSGSQGYAAQRSVSKVATAYAAPVVGGAVPARSHWRINAAGQPERSTGGGPWTPIALGSQANISIIAVSGADVWAGGDRLQLWHSADDGAHWEPLALPAHGHADQRIAHIRLDGPQQVTVEAEDGATWTSSDGGHSWR